MAVLLKTSGGVWRTTPTGGVSIKYNGAWLRANKVYVKQGGVWRDSGYVGYPHAPLNFSLGSSSFSVVNTSWSGPNTGAAVSSYEVLKQDQWGNTYGGYPANVGNVGSHQFAVAEDQRLQLFVRSIGATGLQSAWAGPIKIQIGHTELSHVQPTNYVINWSSPAIQIDLHTGYGGSAAVSVPSNVTVDRMEVHLWSGGLPTWLSAETLPQRHVHYIVNDVVRQDLNGGQALLLYNPHDANLWISGTGGGGWGLYAWGTDYETGPWGYNRVNGSMQVHGTYVETRYPTVIDRYYAGNTTW